jgi:plastocyanin
MLKCFKKITKLKPHIYLPGIIPGLFLSWAFLSSCTSEPEKRAPEIHTIVISSMQFNPAELTLQKGDTVMFINKDLVVHDITQEPDKAWTSSNLSPGHSYRIAVVGSSNYDCSIHPTMKGKLIIQP